jgi:hypothetical protein
MFSIPCSVSRLGLLGAGASAVAGASVLTDAMVVVLVSGASAGVGGETMAGSSLLKGPLPVALPQ